MRLYKLVDTLGGGKDWFIGYELDDGERPAEKAATILHAYSKDDALDQFNDNFWKIAYGDPTNEGPLNVDPRKLYSIIELRPATERDRRPGRF